MAGTNLNQSEPIAARYAVWQRLARCLSAVADLRLSWPTMAATVDAELGAVRRMLRTAGPVTGDGADRADGTDGGDGNDGDGDGAGSTGSNL